MEYLSLLEGRMLLIRQVMVLLGSLLAAITASRALSGLRISRSPGAQVASYLGVKQEEAALERVGKAILLRIPVLRELGRVEQHRMWLELSDDPLVMPETAVGLAVVALAAGLLGAVALNEPFVTVMGVIGGVIAFLRIRSQADAIRRKVERSLPDLCALMAAEMSAGNSPDLALERVSRFGGPLANLLRKAVEVAKNEGKPLFSRGNARGALLEVVGRYDLQAVVSFAAKVDAAAKTGAAGPGLMERLAQTLVILYKDRALREAESLDNKLAVPSVLFFFLPFTMLLLLPLLYPALQVLGE